MSPESGQEQPRVVRITPRYKGEIVHHLQNIKQASSDCSSIILGYAVLKPVVKSRARSKGLDDSINKATVATVNKPSDISNLSLAPLVYGAVHHIHPHQHSRANS